MSRYSSIQKYNPFEMVVDTTIAGSSGVGNMELVLSSNALFKYRFLVDWGDGSEDRITSWNQSETTHNYTSGGTYTINIYGRCDRFDYSQDQVEADKIVSINSFGNVVWKTMMSAFRGADNLVGNFSDTPLMEQVVDLEQMFYLCSSFTGGTQLDTWDVSRVTDIQYMFSQTDFDQDIGNWDVSNVSNMFSLFQLNSSFNNGGSPSISGWTTSACTNMGQMFYGTTFNQPISSWDVSNVSNVSLMFRGATNFNQDIGNWDVSNATTMFQVFRNASSFNNGGSPSISGWTFGTPLNANGHDFNGMFQSASVFNQPIGSWTWPTGSVKKLASMFYSPGGSDFNQDIGSWDVSGVEGSSNSSGFYGMFGFASSFNNGGSPSISGWTFGPNDNTMYQMFNGATNFNQPIGSWNVSGVTNMRNMFSSTTNFNQDIGSWDVSTGTDDKFNSMFFNATAFNNGGSPSISGWTFGNYGPNFSFSGMFWNADSFNQPIGSWNVSGVTNMRRMFNSANNFNQDIGSWDVSGVKGTDTFSGFYEMFQSSVNFNNGGSPSISGWTFGPNPVTMESMFGSTLFNQPIGSWDVSNVTNMATMLKATPFNQYIGSWDVSGVTDMTQMLDSTNTSVTNYNSILTGWTGWNGSTATKTLQSNVSFGCSTCNYSSGSTAEQARNYLITGLTWTITDAGGI